jgi:hypothetical protein
MVGFIFSATAKTAAATAKTKVEKKISLKTKRS